MKRPPKNHDLFFELVQRGAKEGRERLGRFLSEASLTADRTEILRASGAVEDCPCILVPRLVEKQTEALLVTQWLQAQDWKQAVLSAMTEVRGWETLRGRGGRRKELEAILPEDFEEMLPDLAVGQGRPRMVHLGRAAHTEAASLLDHARGPGPDHLEGTLSQLTAAVFVGQVVTTLPSFEILQRSNALAVLREGADLKAGQYQRRRSRLAYQIIAALAGSSERAVRNVCRESQEPLWDVWTQARELLSAIRLAWLADLEERNPDQYEEIRKGPTFGDVALATRKEQVRRIAQASGFTIGEVRRRLAVAEEESGSTAIRRVIQRLGDRGKLDGSADDT